MASDIWLRTILIVRKETRCHHIGYSFQLTARVLVYAPSHRQDSTYNSLCYTSRGALAGMRNSSMCPPWRIDPTTHRTMSERSYHGATSCSHWVADRLLMVGRLNYFLFQPVLHDWYNKGCGLCRPVFGMVHIKDLLLLIGKCSLCSGSSRFPLSLYEWFFTICPTPYNRIKNVFSALLNKTIPSFGSVVWSTQTASNIIIFWG